MRVELVDIIKHFGPIKANDGVSLVIESGELHGILGENGAGKSTLMKILSGFSAMTSGSIRVDGRRAAYSNTAEAVRLGIGMLYQDPMDFQQLTVLDNFMLGQPGRISLHRKSHRREFIRLAESLHFHLDPEAAVRSLTPGERQQLEMLRLLALGVQVLILDEPTTGISTAQREVLYAALRRLVSAGKSVLLVSHKLEDVEALCDRVTVLRLGRITGCMRRPFATQALLTMMFGAPPPVPRGAARPPGADVLVMHGVSSPGGRAGLSDCSVVLHAAEVVGLAGLEGSGQEVFLRVAAGVRAPRRGGVHLSGQAMAGRDHHAFRRQGVAFLPAARLEEALMPGLSITEHLALQDGQPAFRVAYAAAARDAAAKIDGFRIKGWPDMPVEELSGGNQQRLLLSFLPPNPVLLLMEHPTRGLDVESVNWIWQYLRAYALRGACIAFSSSELDEILTVADRVLVFFNGRIVKDVASAATSAEELGRAIAGRAD